MANKAVRQHKEQQVEDLADKLTRSQLAILTDYRGLRVQDLGNLRGRLRPLGVEYTVAKNTLARFAAQRTGREAIIPDLEGPTAIAFVYDDMAAATKALQDFIRTNRVLSVKSGSLGSQRLSAAEVTRIAELPPKAQLQARLVGTIMGPIARLVGAFNGVLSNLVYVLDERAKQLDGGAEAAAS